MVVRMKAVQINRYGGPDVIEVNQKSFKPTPSKKQILIENYAASINPVDSAVREGRFKEMVPLQFPITLGENYAGVIVGVGEDVKEFSVGDQVYGLGSVLDKASGAMAEFVAANTTGAAFKPKTADFIQAAALPLVGSSAIQALEEHIKLKPGQKILIHGGAGGIGHIAIQLAKQLGAYVATTVGTNDKEFVRALGADEVLDYKTEQFETKLKDFDAVYDTVGGPTKDNSFKILKKGGVLVSMLGQPSPELAKQYEVTAIGQGTQTTTQHLTHLAQLVDEGKIKVHVDKAFPIDQARESFVYQEEGHPQGKVVLTIKE